MKFACQRSGRCCSHPKIWITLTHEDLFRLLSITNTPEDLQKIVSFLKIDSDMTKTDHEELLNKLVLPPVLSTEGEVIPVLRKKNENPECIFYDSSNHACTIYDYRPLACRNFPLGFTEFAGKKAITWNELGKEFCPGINKGEELTKEQLKSLIKETETIMKNFKTIVEEINIEAINNNPLTPQEILYTLIYISSKKKTLTAEQT